MSIKEIAKKGIIAVGQSVPGLSTVARIIHFNTTHKGTYPGYRKQFVENGRHSRFGEYVRENIVRRFEIIDHRLDSRTTPTDGLVLTEAMLSMDSEGDIVECGCFSGASTAKLSIVAQVLEKRLIIFDSFEGLPGGGEKPVHTRLKVNDVGPWISGDLSAGLDLVRQNIESFGEISVCSLVKGWFSETLHQENLPDQIAAAFTDVDLASSARECLLAIWPLVSTGGIFFSHDVAYIHAMQALCDEDLWTNELKSFPPIFFGSGFGICDLSPHLGYMIKGSGVSAEYLKSLTLSK